MARIRTIKPEFWTSEQIMDCKPVTRLLFIGLWNFVDDFGRAPVAPRTIKAQVMPGDELSGADIQDMLNELSSHGLILFYSANDKEYFEITGWAKHQKIDNPSKYKVCPAPFSEQSQIVAIPSDESLSIGLEGKGGDRKGKKESCPVPKRTRTMEKYSEEFETSFWKPFPRTGIMSKKEAWREWMKLDPGRRHAACQAIEPYKKHLKQNPTLQAVHACRFLSQDRAEGILEISSEKPAWRGHFV
jgi:hypothetical protein